MREIGKSVISFTYPSHTPILENYLELAKKRKQLIDFIENCS